MVSRAERVLWHRTSKPRLIYPENMAKAINPIVAMIAPSALFPKVVETIC